jgi:hypothetical protein
MQHEMWMMSWWMARRVEQILVLERQRTGRSAGRSWSVLLLLAAMVRFA